ncbi:MAG: hypothetical protein AB7U72_14870, partial [Methanosarcina sp.]
EICGIPGRQGVISTLCDTVPRRCVKSNVKNLCCEDGFPDNIKAWNPEPSAPAMPSAVKQIDRKKGP